MLSEKNYQQTGSVLGVPVIKSKKRNTSIEGSVYIKNLIPLKYEKLRLLDLNGLAVAETTTTQNGSFNFQANLSNGDYLIKVESEEYTGEATIKVDDYQLRNIKINAKPKTATDTPHS